MLTSAQLKKIGAEARPIIERQIDDALKLAGLRDVVSAAGGDWSQLKALIKAQIQDEGTGDGKRVRKILDKAEYATAYADMLGLGPNMNEFNIPDEAADQMRQWARDRIASGADEPEHDADGVIIEPEETNGGIHETHGIANDPISSVAATAAVNCDDDMAAGAGSSAGGGSGASASDVEPVAPIHPSEAALLPQTEPVGARNVSAGQASVESPATNITQFHRHNAETHFLNSKGLPRLKACQNPEACGGSHRALCFSCSVANDGPAYSDGAA